MVRTHPCPVAYTPMVIEGPDHISRLPNTDDWTEPLYLAWSSSAGVVVQRGKGTRRIPQHCWIVLWWWRWCECLCLSQLCRHEEDEDLLDPWAAWVAGVHLSDCTHRQGQQVGSAFTPSPEMVSYIEIHGWEGEVEGVYLTKDHLSNWKSTTIIVRV